MAVICSRGSLALLLGASMWSMRPWNTAEGTYVDYFLWNHNKVEKLGVGQECNEGLELNTLYVHAK